MKKKTRNNNRKVNIPTDGTLLENFKKYIETHRKKSDIMDFLAVTNARYIGLAGSDNLSEDTKDEIIEFAIYFYKNFYPVMQLEIMDNWGTDPYILQLAAEIHEEREDRMYWKDVNDTIESAPDYIREEAMTLADTLFEIRKERRFIFAYDDATVSYNLPKVIPKSFIDSAKKELLAACIKIVQNCGCMTAKVTEKDITEKFAIVVYLNHMWVPLSAEEYKKALLTSKDGFVIEPEENVVITEIQRLKCSWKSWITGGLTHIFFSLQLKFMKKEKTECIGKM